MFEKQGWHLIFLLFILTGVAFLAQGQALAGSLWGLSTVTWLWLAIAVPVFHQILVVLLWRGQLYHGWMTNTFGERGFFIFKIAFTLLFVLRPVTVLLLGLSNFRTLTCPPGVMVTLGIILLFPFGFTMLSVVRYFGLDRAYGIDHFDLETYRAQPLVREGMFRYTENAMYKFGFLILWSLAFFTSSRAALLAAAFNHLYIWVHYYFTELPDMAHIYGKR
jgi:hypothetical protein